MTKDRLMNADRISVVIQDLVRANERHQRAEEERGRWARERGLLAADLYFIDGVPTQRLSEKVSLDLEATEDRSRTSVRKWICQHSPASYVLVCQLGTRYQVKALRLPTSETGQLMLDKGRRLIKQHQDAGWRVAPSRWGLQASDVDGADLWERIGQ